MAAEDTLNGSQAGKGQEIAEGLHADIEINKDIESDAGDRVLGALKVFWNAKRLSGEAGIDLGIDRAIGDQCDIEIVLKRQSYDDFAKAERYGMVVQIFGEEANTDFSVGAGNVLGAMRADEEQGRACAGIEFCDFDLKITIIQSVVGEIEIGMPTVFQGVVEREVIGDELVEFAFESLAGCKDLLLCAHDGGQHEGGTNTSARQPEFLCSVIAILRFLKVPLCLKNNTKVVMRQGKIRIDSQCLAVAQFSFNLTFLLYESIAQVVMRVGEFRIDLNGATIAGFGICVSVELFKKKDSQVVLRFGIVGR